MNTTSYFVYRTKMSVNHNQPVQAKLTPTDFRKQFPQIKSPLQVEPYGVDVRLTYQVRSRWKLPDNLVDDVGFPLYSNRLITILKEYGVKFESFPAEIIDEAGNKIELANYEVFHLLEDVYALMDEQKSGWTGDRHDGINPLILDYERFDHKPIMLLEKLYLRLMRSDLKTRLNEEKITGFDFLLPEKYKSGNHGMVFEYND